MKTADMCIRKRDIADEIIEMNQEFLS